MKSFYSILLKSYLNEDIAFYFLLKYYYRQFTDARSHFLSLCLMQNFKVFSYHKKEQRNGYISEQNSPTDFVF